jgi:predicted nucleic acid-binding protein
VITAVDTNVLLDVLTAHPEFGQSSLALLRSCRTEGGLIACEVVWAEVTSNYSAAETADAAMAGFELAFSPLNREAATIAGTAWREYRRRGGPRTRVVPDFLIGAHASSYADRLLTRDRGFYRSYFRGLTVLDPSKR